MSKHLHPGKAAFNGILAADLAREGFTGASRILEGDRGFFRAMSESSDASRITDQLGRHWKILENCYKLHSCCGHTHTAIDVALDLRREHISAIHIETYASGFEIVKEMNPRTPYQAKFSIACCVAAALAEGVVGLEQFSADRFSTDGVVEPAIAALLRKTRVSVDPALTAKYPAAWPARITIALDEGTVLTGESDFPRGNPENPVSTVALEAKFRVLIEPRFGSAVAERAIRAIGEIETSTDMSTAFRDLV
jgi:2-methylcitrate dehydratase PrpD